MDEGDEQDAPELGAFLDLLDRDIADHPERLVPVTKELFDRIQRLTAGVVVNLDEEVEGPVAL